MYYDLLVRIFFVRQAHEHSSRSRLASSGCPVLAADLARRLRVLKFEATTIWVYVSRSGRWRSRIKGAM